MISFYRSYLKLWFVYTWRCYLRLYVMDYPKIAQNWTTNFGEMYKRDRRDSDWRTLITTQYAGCSFRNVHFIGYLGFCTKIIIPLNERGWKECILYLYIQCYFLEEQNVFDGKVIVMWTRFCNALGNFSICCCSLL